MTPVLIGKDSVLEELKPQNRGHSQVPGIFPKYWRVGSEKSITKVDHFQLHGALLIFSDSCRKYPRKTAHGHPSFTSMKRYESTTSFFQKKNGLWFASFCHGTFFSKSGCFNSESASMNSLQAKSYVSPWRRSLRFDASGFLGKNEKMFHGSFIGITWKPKNGCLGDDLFLLGWYCNFRGCISFGECNYLVGWKWARAGAVIGVLQNQTLHFCWDPQIMEGSNNTLAWHFWVMPFLRSRKKNQKLV